MKSSPSIAVCVPTFNRYKDLENLIKSFILQKYPNSFLNIYDDLGSPLIHKTVLKWQKHDKRIKYFKNKTNLGFTENFRSMCVRAKEDYLVFMGDDDIFIDNDALEYFVKAFENKQVASVKARQVVYKKNGVNQVFDISKVQEDFTTYRKGHDTFLNLWFESLSITGLAFRNGELLRKTVTNDPTLYPQVEIMGKLSRYYDSVCINKHLVAIKSHSNQLNCMMYDLVGVTTNILYDWVNLYKRVSSFQYGNMKSEKCIPKPQYLSNLTKFISIFLPHNSITNGKIDTWIIAFTMIKLNPQIVLYPLFLTGMFTSILFPKFIVQAIIETVKFVRLQKNLSSSKKSNINAVINQYNFTTQ